jgi:spoIIIJ-associated protein
MNDIIKSTLEEFIQKMGFEASIELQESVEDDQSSIVCNITTKDDSSFLIGQYGANLQAIQHIARLFVRKKTSEKTNFILDVNSYRKEKNESVIEMAKEAANQAIAEKRAVVMKPMSNYERRIVHMELSKNNQITTESIGEGEGRKVVIKPADSI